MICVQSRKPVKLFLLFFPQVWKRHAPHPWKGNKHSPETLQCLANRLNEVNCGSVPEHFLFTLTRTGRIFVLFCLFLHNLFVVCFEYSD